MNSDLKNILVLLLILIILIPITYHLVNKSEEKCISKGGEHTLVYGKIKCKMTE